MAIKSLKPRTAGARFRSFVTSEGLSGDKPTRALLKGKQKISGRNNSGRITVRRRGGGLKRKYRQIDFRRD